MVASTPTTNSLNPAPATLLAIRAGDGDAFARFWSHWRPRVQYMAKRQSAADREDYEAIGMVALWEACGSFPMRGRVGFVTYATWAIRYAMIDELRARLTAKATSISVVDPVELRAVLCSDGTPLDVMLSKEALARAMSWLHELSERERAILEGACVAETTQRVLARRLGLAPARITQIKQALLAEGKRAVELLN